MNNKTTKLLRIRSKNDMRRRGFDLRKWKLKKKTYPFKWVNTNPVKGILEDSWIIDARDYRRSY